MTLPFGIPAGRLAIHRTVSGNKYIGLKSPCRIIATIITALIGIKSIINTIKPRLYICLIPVHEIFGQNIVMIDFQIVITRTGSTQGEEHPTTINMVKTFLINMICYLLSIRLELYTHTERDG